VITLVMFTRRRDIIETLVNRSSTMAAIACSAAIFGLDLWLLGSPFARSCASGCRAVHYLRHRSALGPSSRG
jgi:hypothetical protein